MGHQIANSRMPSGWYRATIPTDNWFSQNDIIVAWLIERPGQWAYKVKAKGRLFIYFENRDTAFEFKIRWG